MSKSVQVLSVALPAGLFAALATRASTMVAGWEPVAEAVEETVSAPTTATIEANTRILRIMPPS
jgi:type IV secretory pathway VirB2 component (pilin)